MLLDGVRGIVRDLVFRGVTILDAEVVVLEIDVQVRMNQALLDEVPDNPGHLVAIELDDLAYNLDLCHAAALLNNAARVLEPG